MCVILLYCPSVDLPIISLLINYGYDRIMYVPKLFCLICGSWDVDMRDCVTDLDIQSFKPVALIIIV